MLPNLHAPRTPAVLLQLGVFSPQIGTDFYVKRGSESVTLHLSEGNALGGHQAVAREKFSLIFVGGNEQPLQQGIHEFDHPALGEFELFITPVLAGRPGERCYEAIINRESA